MTSRVAIKIPAPTRLFNVPFPYLSQQHVTVSVNRRIQLPGLDYNWTEPTNIEFVNDLSVGDIVEARRVTPSDGPLVSFYNGAVLTEAELNLAVRQSLYLCQEIRDYYDALINGALDSLVLESGNEVAGPVIDRVIADVLNSSLLADLQQRITDIDTNAQTITATQIDLNNVRELVDALSQIDGQGIATVIANERSERIEGDTALASTLALIGARSGDGLSFIFDLAKVKVSPSESLAQRLTAIQSSLSGNAATIATEVNTRATADSALSTRIDNVSATVTTKDNEVRALISAEATARANADGAATTRMDGMLATIGNNDTAVKALILAEQNARVAADSAEASARQTLQTTVNGHTASIQSHASSINGLSAQWTIKTDVNGRVAGIGLMNSGVLSEFIVNVDRFAFVTPGANPVVPFAADANGVYMNQAYIRNLVVDKISGGAIQSEWAINSSSGRIVLDTGTHMKVIGVGFGANADLVEWYGPKMAVASCTKANGITWTDKSGNAYWGGSLSAGTLHSAGRFNLNSTNWNSATYATVQHVGSLGRPKTLVVSAVIDFGQRDAGNTQFSHNGSPKTGTIIFGLFRGATEIARWSRTVTSSAEFFPLENGNPDSNYTQVWQVFAFGSQTLTDPYAGTGTVTYTMKVISSSGAFYPQNGGSFNLQITEV